MEDNRVNLFVVGAMKSGTTSFVDTLIEHPSICISPIKEPHHFVHTLPTNLYSPSRYFSLESYFSETFPAPLHIAHVTKLTDYKRLFDECSLASYRLDASTAYMHAPESAELIHVYHEEAKCVMLLRDPIKRAYSHYTMDVGLGRQSKSFEQLISSEIEQYTANTLPWNSYLGMSFYSKAIERYERQFGKEQLLVIRFEELIEDRTITLQKVAQFLGISDFDEQIAVHKNKSRTMRFKGVIHLLTKLGIKDVFSRVFGTQFKQGVFKMISQSNSTKIPLSSEIKEELTRIFDKES